MEDQVGRDTPAVPCWEINVPVYSITPASRFLLLQPALMYHWERIGQTSLKTGNVWKQKQEVIAHSCFFSVIPPHAPNLDSGALKKSS